MNYAEHTYNRLIVIGDTIAAINEQINSAIRAINQNDRYVDTYINIVEKQFKISGDSIQNWINDTNSNDQYQNFSDLADAKPIVLGYSEVIHQYNEALNGLDYYKKTKNMNDTIKVFDLLDKTRADIEPFRTKANDKHFEYYNKIQNY